MATSVHPPRHVPVEGERFSHLRTHPVAVVGSLALLGTGLMESFSEGVTPKNVVAMLVAPPLFYIGARLAERLDD
jgi:hypothetical protein